ncbi:MAG: lysine--tRNA ligase [bacterium JZ-2024 1]
MEEKRRLRLMKLEEWKKAGIDPYYAEFRKEMTIQTARGKQGEKVATAGRILAMRHHGKACFADLWDESGKIQLYAKEEILGAKYRVFVDLDIGDIVGVKGEVFTSRTGEITIRVEEFTPLAKSLLEFPEKWHKLKDPELRERKRYLDYLVNEESRRLFEIRIRLLKKLREFFWEKGFLEVETPILHPVYGGAFARPFETYHHALEQKLYLRIAPELYLKKLLVAGFEKIFEIGKNFRNEGISRKHNPEFTMLEAYQAYANYEDMAELVEECIGKMIQEITGSLDLHYQGKTIDCRHPWERITFWRAMETYAGCKREEMQDIKEARKKARELGIDEAETYTQLWEIYDEIFKERVEKHLEKPTFVLDHPVETTPLAKRKKDDPGLVYRFELFIAGMEVVNAFTELNDPVEQRRRLEMQKEEREKEGIYHPMDEEFLEAMEYGMPPAGGIGIGVDRLAMLVGDAYSLRETLAFPLLRPEGS